MNINHFNARIISVIFITVGLFALRAQTPPVVLPPPLPDSFVAGLGITNALEEQAVSNRVAYLDNYTNENVLRAAYDNGLITRGEDIWIKMQWENSRVQDIYGMVVDQSGQPIAGVDVTGSVAHHQGYYAEDRWDEYKTKSDAQGLFQFTGLTGADWSINVEKEGYKMDYRLGWSGPRGGSRGTRTSPGNRAILTMWKLRGAEPMVHIKTQAGLACDGAPRGFDLLTGQRSSKGGDLIATLIRNPLHIERHKHFDWTLTLAIPNGGLADFRGGYPYEAPQTGYQGAVTISMPASTNDWAPSFRHSFFFKSRNGQNYGIMTIDLMANYEPPPTHFAIDAYVNPAGSRNLEIDPQKIETVH